MSYGLVVKNTTLKTQIDSTEEMFGMAVKANGTGTSVTGINFATDVVAIRLNNLAAGGNSFVVGSWNADRTTVTFHDGDHREFTTMPSVTVQYVHLTQARNTGFDYGTTNYGLQTKTPSGAIGFDSRALVATVRPVFMNLFPQLYFKPYSNNLGNYPNLVDEIVGNLTDYVSMSHSSVGAPGAAPVYPTFGTGVRFLNNVFDSEEQRNRTGAFYDSNATLGEQPNTLNYGTIQTIRDVS